MEPETGSGGADGRWWSGASGGFFGAGVISVDKTCEVSEARSDGADFSAPDFGGFSDCHDFGGFGGPFVANAVLATERFAAAGFGEALDFSDDRVVWVRPGTDAVCEALVAEPVARRAGRVWVGGSFGLVAISCHCRFRSSASLD